MEKTSLLSKRAYLFLVLSLLSFLGEAQTYTNIIPGTYTIKVPAGVTSLQAEAWGAGGAGAARKNDALRTGGGGGGGYARTSNIAVNSTTNYTVTVGAGGTSTYVNSTTVTKVNGGASSFGSTVIATGGQTPEAWANSGATGATGSTGATTYNGGNGGLGGYYGHNYGYNYSASGGGGAGSTGAGSNGTNSSNTLPSGGAGASVDGGQGGNGRTGNGAGNPGANYGGGGGGVAEAGYNGGAGAGGKIVLTYSCPTYSLTSTTAQTTTPSNSSTITVTGSAAGLPVGTYTVTYNLGSPNTATNNTATMTVSTAGTGTFSTTSLTNSGTTTITINTLSSGTGTTCNTTITANHTASITVSSLPTIQLTGNSIVIPKGDTTPTATDNTNFGTVHVLSPAVIKTFTITNIGTGTLTLSGSPTISGTNSSDFSLTAAPSTTILAGASTTFQISSYTTTTGTKTATVSITSNDTANSPYTFAIEGEGVQYFYDSDGDFVLDDVDVDDDNDGILDTTEETNCNLNFGNKIDYKFLYETFGAGARTTINATYNATTTYCYQNASTSSSCDGGPNSTDLNDGKYTVGPSAQIASWATNYWYKGVDHTGDTNGRMAIFNASFTPGVFYTALISGAIPNFPITYSFWVLNLDRTDAPGIATRLRPNIRVEFRDINDNVLQTISTGAIPPTTAGDLNGNWIQFTANLTLNVNVFKVIFINNETGGIGNDLALDDILITQQLCDRDGDGIADLYDLDSDNDGIPDVVEAGLGNLSNGRGKIDIAWVDTNGNGLHNSAESAAALAALDSDGDGIPNYIDLDSDNDSVFDVDESKVSNSYAIAGFDNGDGDINGDGRGDGTDSETFRSKDTNGDGTIEGFGDGILNIYDYGTGSTFNDEYGNLGQGSANANPTITYLTDTDGDGIPDYIDIYNNTTGVFDIANNKLIYAPKVLDSNNDGKIDGTADVDRDGIIDTFDTAYSPRYFGSPRDMNTKLYLDFDGRNDYGQSTAILGGLANASLMAWIDLNPTFSNTGLVVGQTNFQIRITSAKNLEAVVNGTTITDTTVLNVSQWYNVGTTYDGTTIKLYLNGVLVQSKAASGAIATDTSLLTIGKNPITNTAYFKGKIDEVRVFNTALTASQLQRMVYQEINSFGSEIRGEVVPKNVATSPSSLPFANLLRYYRMDAYKDDIIDDYTTSAIDLTGTKIYNHKNIHIQQAPMPFITERSGGFAIAVDSPTNDVRGLDIMDNDYSIVRIKHDITETSNAVDLGMFVDSNKTIVMNNDTKIQNDWYLKLDGKIDLEGKSQLVQSTESDLDVTSAGSIERDQQGQSNLYNYNYWSSPVSPINTTSNNNNYTVNSMMRDGTNPALPANINWVNGYNGSPTSPISLAKYWLYKFDNYANNYFSWIAITPTDDLRVGQAFTLKGSGATGLQNYVFVGKPNNGLINSNLVTYDQLLLIGNPYPSALDATAFINDNTNTIDGTLYFWEHYASNNTHILRDYQGGYAERNLTGGLAPVAPPEVSGLGSSTRTPGRYIPVGQGFIVNGKTGTSNTAVIFKNSQREFHKENETGVSNILFKTRATAKTGNSNNDNDPIAIDTLKRIRLGFNSSNMYHRQVLLGFMNDKATDELDYGYDAHNYDDFPNDMYFVNEDNELVIQGVGFFNASASYPIGIKTTDEGTVSFTLDDIENFDSQQGVFIYDKLLDSYHDIRQEKFEIQMTKGVENDRFSLRFTNKNLSTEDNILSEGIDIKYIRNGNILLINNNLLDVKVEAITLYNILGQSIATWKIENQEQSIIEIPIKNRSPGVYFAKVKTSKNDITKKFIISEK